MPTIPHDQLRDNVAELLRRAEAGEEFTITVEGRPVAQLGPRRRLRWVSGRDLRRVWETPGAATLSADSDKFPDGFSDPFV